MLASFIFERKNISFVNTQIKILELSLWEYNLFFACFNSLDSLTDDAWVSGPDLAPQKFLLFQKFRHLMIGKKFVKVCLQKMSYK